MPRLQIKRAWVFLIVALGGVAVFAFSSGIVQAQGLGADLSSVGASVGVPDVGLKLLIARIIRWVIVSLGMVFLSLTVYAGVKYMLAGGDPKKAQSALAILRDAIIGLAIVLASYAIATFVINSILRAAGASRVATSSQSGFIEPLSGSLGAGIIQDHYPERNAEGVPRNTKIIVTFKEPIARASLMTNTNLNAANVKIYRTADGQSQALTSAQVNVAATEDLKTFVFDPVPLLGSAVANQNYTVFLSPNIQKLLADMTTTAPAFPPPFASGYTWSFTISTVIDTTPPQVMSFVPASNGTYDRNIVVQVNFNEAIDPTSASGIHHPTANTAQQFRNLQLRNDRNSGALIEGTYRVSNGYRTVEFVSFDQCGENACGGAIFCLPGGADFTILARAATLGAEPPSAVFTSTGYDGVVDVAGNSLDGGGHDALLKNGVANGPPTASALTPSASDDLAVDNFWTVFHTTNVVNTNRPHLSSILPTQNQGDVSPSQDVRLTFDIPMRASTLTNQFVAILPRPAYELWYRVISEDIVAPAPVDAPASAAPTVTGTTAVVSHGALLDYEAGDPPRYYYPIVNNEVTSAYQICFYPAYGPPNDCGVSAASPSCCQGTASALGQCPIPAP